MPNYSIKEYTKLMRPLPDSVERGKYGIPYIERQDIDINRLLNGIELINIHNISSKDKHSGKKIVHSFHYDADLRREYNNPFNFLRKVRKYYAVSSFDFSMHKRMSEAQIIEATFANRWIGAFLQTNGKISIACVGWVTQHTYDICFEGLRDGAVFIISTLGVNNNICVKDFIDGYNEMRLRFPNSTIICVGDRVEGMDDDVCYISYKQSFGNRDKYQDYWQPRLFNWNFTEVLL